MRLNDLVNRAKQVVEKRGGTGALKEDAQELKDIASSKGSTQDKAKRAAEALKDPGAPGGPERTGEPTRTASRRGRTSRSGRASLAADQEVTRRVVSGSSPPSQVARPSRGPISDRSSHRAAPKRSGVIAWPPPRPAHR